LNLIVREKLKNDCSERELERRLNSLLFDRLVLSKDKVGVMQLALKDQEINKPADAIKEPVVLDSLDSRKV
jgi:predicted nuclease of restriction endonuclease-like (RecB) superfamily